MHAEIEVKEALLFLRKLKKEQPNHRLKTRIQSLILTKENKFNRRIDLAIHLSIGIASLNRWTIVSTALPTKFGIIPFNSDISFKNTSS